MGLTDRQLHLLRTGQTCRADSRRREHMGVRTLSLEGTTCGSWRSAAIRRSLTAEAGVTGIGGECEARSWLDSGDEFYV